MSKSWDLNIFFKEDYNLETQETTWDDVLTINPAVYVVTPEGTSHIYTNIIIKATFAETRFIRSLRTEAEYGDDWFEDRNYFIRFAPPRLRSLLLALPDPETVGKELVS